MMSSQDRSLVLYFLLVFLGFTERACSSFEILLFVGIPYALWVRLTFVFYIRCNRATLCTDEIVCFFLRRIAFDAALF